MEVEFVSLLLYYLITKSGGYGSWICVRRYKYLIYVESGGYFFATMR